MKKTKTEYAIEAYRPLGWSRDYTVETVELARHEALRIKRVTGREIRIICITTTEEVVK